MSESAIKLLDQMVHDKIVVMQAAFIEWKHGAGAEAAMQWIANTLEGPGLIPQESEPYAKDAQKYFSANKSNPLPECEICGDPSNIAWMGMGFCSDEHYKQRRNN